MRRGRGRSSVRTAARRTGPEPGSARPRCARVRGCCALGIPALVSGRSSPSRSPTPVTSPATRSTSTSPFQRYSRQRRRGCLRGPPTCWPSAATTRSPTPCSGRPASGSGRPRWFTSMPTWTPGRRISVRPYPRHAVPPCRGGGPVPGSPQHAHRHPRAGLRPERPGGGRRAGLPHVHAMEIEPSDRLRVRRIRERVGDAPLYISIDIDVLDPAHAPGTGTPEAGGLTSRELLGILRGLAGIPAGRRRRGRGRARLRPRRDDRGGGRARVLRTARADAAGKALARSRAAVASPGR